MNVGGRPVRQRPRCFLAAGGQELLRVMKRAGGAPGAVHRTEQGRRRAPLQRPASSWPRVKGDVHDIGKNIVGVVLQL